MTYVNPYELDAFVRPLIGLADDDEAVETYRKVDMNDELVSKEIIARVLKPDFFKRHSSTREAAKLSLKYYLTKPNTDFARVIDGNLLPFAAPCPARSFFIWIWEVFFGDESYHLESWQSYKVETNVDVTYKN